ncbi:K+-sensing histidine kinase KdpD [Rhizobium leguminosarum]|uniref:K+-sensing histidine kinase KdpD n=1 Tax=Rhizobium leguminosarum TaxID=384 RepID=A0A7Z0J130_RHILE|nr:DUF4118 domain-containing protein [Rhizobium leguminosarum]NYJ14348.1 K+-sensing histidine kinase KdpD [Rhizobium leguminosarum]
MSRDKDFSAAQIETAIADYNVSGDLDFSEMPPLAQYCVCLIMTAMATAIAAGFDRYEAIPNLSLIYVVPVVIGSVLFGLGPALFSAVLGALAYNFFFTEPRFSLAVADTANIWAITVLFVIACVISAITSWGRRKGIDLQRTRQAQVALRVYAEGMAASRSIDDAARLTVASLKGFFQAPAVVLLSANGICDPQFADGERLTAIEMEAAISSSTSNSVVSSGVYPYDESRFDFWPVATISGRGRLSVLPSTRIGAPRIPARWWRLSLLCSAR